MINFLSTLVLEQLISGSRKPYDALYQLTIRLRCNSHLLWLNHSVSSFDVTCDGAISVFTSLTPTVRHEAVCLGWRIHSSVCTPFDIPMYVLGCVFTCFRVSATNTLYTLFSCQCPSVSGNLGVYAAN